MSNPTEQSPAAEPAVSHTDAETTAQAPHHPHGYTMADEEMERLEAKRASGDVLDPIALNDPVGQSVERVILRVGVAVVAVLVVGILLAQIACKNIQLSGVTDFSETAVTGETVDTALKGGIIWGGSVVKFSGVEDVQYDRDSGAVSVKIADDGSRTFDRLVSDMQGRAMALAMNLFEDEAVDSVTVEVTAHADADTGVFSGRASDPVQTVLTLTWARSAEDPATFDCTMRGYDPATYMTDSDLANAEAAK